MATPTSTHQDSQASSEKPFCEFVIIFVLGAPAAGKTTLCARLAKEYGLINYSFDNDLFVHLRESRRTPTGDEAQDKLSNQGYPSQDLSNRLICSAISRVMRTGVPGILIEGFPRGPGEMQSLRSWPFMKDLPFRLRGGTEVGLEPDAVIALKVSKKSAETRFIGHESDSSERKNEYENRLEYYLREAVWVEESYKQLGVVVELDANKSKEAVALDAMSELEKKEMWQRAGIRRLKDGGDSA